ncbi:hypothetical protein FVF58_09345 [Paraburkholderia panacisoli]|uniref:Uncharacterized protein n=1 Tax=Paraburkholderia panacisoli TaxID=2603818 RepID=A0A5B0HD77_9BURK|nr:hypothetical protein [Paraburkholderia panacisoli]KAA1012988.1 hypothetical protein FVF58_09345 [Paraburkholderia panacisoli]
MFDAFEAQRKAMLRQMVEAADNSPEAKRKRAIEALGERWVFHPKHAPERGVYNPLTGRRLA